MSLVADLFSLVGPTPPPVPQGERADAAGFEGMLDAAGERPRGLLGLGRRLAEQSRAETARMDDNGPLVGGDPLVLPGLLTGVGDKLAEPLINPGPGGDSRSGDPLINPGVPTGKADGPLINPGVVTKSDGPLVNPGVEAGDGQPLVNPGEPVAGDGVQVLPPETPAPGVADGVLEILAQTGQAVRADAAAAAVRQAVGRAPEVSTTPQAAEVTPAELDIEAPALDAAPAASASTTVAGAQASTTGAQSGPVDQAQARPEAGRTAVESAPATEGDVTLAEMEAAPLPAATDTGAPAATRADAIPVHRMAADAIAQISAQIIRRLEGRSTRFDIELNPHDLGKIDVRLDIDAEGRLAARLAFDNPAAAADLRGRVDDLRRDLEQAGFQLSDDAFSFADREGARERREGLADGSLRSFARSAEASDEADLASQPALRAMTRLGLDVRV